jgi:hypothetical protein
MRYFREAESPLRPVLTCIALALVIAGVSAGCREVAGDRTYALWLDHAPSEADWQRSLPRNVTVRGGRPHKLKSFAEIDQDTVHTTTASCHHGSQPPQPVEVDIRAFYTDQDLYLRLSWPDATRDQSMMDWRFDGKQWQNSGALEDGFGLAWDAEGSFQRFTCSYACHINNFGVARSTFIANNKMRLAEGDPRWLDLWNWKAARTARLGFADDRYLDAEGMRGDVAGEIFQPNSKVALDPAGQEVFAEDDQPLYDAERAPAPEGFHPPGSTAPGYLVERPVGNRADVSALSRYEDGRWIVVLRRALDTGDPHDVIFIPGDRVGVSFGLSLMDHSRFEHYASGTVEQLVLLPRQ